MQKKTFKIQISGCVQGVGFRPFVFNLAQKNQFLGTVSNDAQGVIIFINCSEKEASDFLEYILQNKPKVSAVISHSLQEVSFVKFDNFTIIPTKNKEQINIPLTPDFAVCQSCTNEIKDPKNRRYQYAFTTCVHCGARYSITTKFPFERKHTTLADFEMCKNCKQEYQNPSNKRFHSQTNSCKECGIKLELANNLGNSIENNQNKIIKKVANLIGEGKIIAIKNTNGYLLCCDAKNKTAIQTLRQAKRRANKPFALLYPTISAIQADFDLSELEKNTLQSSIAPIVILQNTKNTKIAVQNIAPKLHQTGVMLPSSALLALLMQELKTPILATSGNTQGTPIISKKKEAQKKLQNIADYFLHHNLEIEFAQDDALVRIVDDKRLILRRSRGFAPNYLGLATQKSEPVLAMGSQLKSTFTFLPNRHIYLSQYFGNLANYEVLERFEASINQFTKLFDCFAKTILIDKHPQYQSHILGKELAEKWKANSIEIQHHKAHFASILGEHDLFHSQQKILGVIWDGTGLGDDQNIWGGEFFIYQNQKINRKSHFAYFDWIANDKMAKEPRLSLLSLLNAENRNSIKNKFSQTEWNIYTKILAKSKLKTSSVGRLFDAVASLLNLVDKNSYEAEAGMLLENCASQYTQNDYIDFLEGQDYEKIPSQVIIEKMLKAHKQGLNKNRLAYSFIYTLAKVIIRFAQKNKIKMIACSGGVFQNSILISILSSLMAKENLALKLHHKLSPNDENISFGQLMYYQNIKN